MQILKQRKRIVCKGAYWSGSCADGQYTEMGAGTNCQDRLVALHHLDVGWRPSDMTQRNGRIIRQGNQNKEVQIYQYVTEGTFDAYLYQTLETSKIHFSDYDLEIACPFL